MRISFLILMALALSGCRTIWDPTFMPAGYTYHGNLYKSPVGSEAAPVGYKFSTQNNEDVLQVWALSIPTLVDSFEMQSGLTPQQVYLTPSSPANAFMNTFDHALREELFARGYTFAKTESMTTPVISYHAEALPSSHDNKHQQQFSLTLSLLDTSLSSQEQVISTVSETMILPPYGYQHQVRMNTVKNLTKSMDGYSDDSMYNK